MMARAISRWCGVCGPVSAIRCSLAIAASRSRARFRTRVCLAAPRKALWTCEMLGFAHVSWLLHALSFVGFCDDSTISRAACRAAKFQSCFDALYICLHGAKYLARWSRQ